MFHKSVPLILFLPIIMLSNNASAEMRVKVTGLFSQKAMVEVNGTSRFLSVGKPSPEGVTLLSANSRTAHLQWEGKRSLLRLSDQVASVFSKVTSVAPSISHIKIHKSPHSGLYTADGSINGRHTEFIVDTGAELVGMNSKEAGRLGIKYQKGQQTMVSTASGTAAAYRILLNKISVGGIEVSGVEAVVIDGDYPTYNLLGLSFLEHVNLSEMNGVISLTLRDR